MCVSTPRRCLGNSACGFPVVSRNPRVIPWIRERPRAAAEPGSLPLAKRGRFARASSFRWRPEASSAALLSGTWAERPARCSGGPARDSSALVRMRRPGASCLPGRPRLISAQSTIRRPRCVGSRRAGRRGCRSAGATGARPEHQRRARAAARRARPRPATPAGQSPPRLGEAPRCDAPDARGVRKLSPSDRNRSFAGDDRVLAPLRGRCGGSALPPTAAPGIFPRLVGKRLTRSGARSPCR